MSQSPSTQSESQTPSQRVPTKKRKRADHDAELLPLLQGPSVEVVVGTGDDRKSWTLPVELLSHHSEHLRATLCDTVKQEMPTTKNVTLPDRPASVFAIFLQWIYTDTIPKRFDLSRLSTGDTISHSFQLWTISDYLQTEEFKTRIMSELCASYSLNRYLDGFDFMELSPAEVNYCWTSTNEGSMLGIFLLDILSHHITYGNYIRVEAENDWHKTFVKHADLQMQLLAQIGASKNTFTCEVAVVVALETYLETTKSDMTEKVDESERS